MQAVLRCAARGFGPRRFLLRGLPLLFLSVSLLYVLEGFLKFRVLAAHVFRKGSRWLGVPKQHVDMFVKP